MRGVFYRIDELNSYKISSGTASVNNFINCSEEFLLDIGEAWGMIDFVARFWRGGAVTSKMVLGGRVLESNDVREVYFVSVAEVADISQDIIPLTYEWFDVCFSLKNMRYEETYLAATSPLSRQQLKDFAWDYFCKLKSFFAQAAADKQGIVFILTSTTL